MTSVRVPGAGSADLVERESSAGAPAPRNSAVVRFFTGITLSMYGDWLSTVALVVVLFELTGSAVGPAGYVLARVAPRVMGPVVGGGLIDRFSARHIAMATSAVQGAVTATLIWSHAAGATWAIFAAVASAQFVGSVGRPAQVSVIPALVTPARLPRANAVFSLMNGSSIFIAPAIGAVLLSRTGPDLLFAIDAASFLASAVLMASLPRTRRATEGGAQATARPRLFDTAGFAQAMRDPTVRIVVAVNFAMGLAATVTQSVLVVAAHERFHSDAAVGSLYSAVGIGCTLGGVTALRWTPPRHRVRTAVAAGYVVGLLSLAAFGATPWLVLGLVLLAVSTICETVFDVWGTTEVQRRAPGGHMGRYNSVVYAALYAGMLLGAVWALGASQLLHWDRVVEIACVAMVGVVVATWISGRDREVTLRGVAQSSDGSRRARSGTTAASRASGQEVQQ